MTSANKRKADGCDVWWFSLKTLRARELLTPSIGEPLAQPSVALSPCSPIPALFLTTASVSPATPCTLISSLWVAAGSTQARLCRATDTVAPSDAFTGVGTLTLLVPRGLS